MGKLKRNFLAISLCLASLLSISKGEETSFANARRDFSDSIMTRYHHFHVEKENYNAEQHFIGSHNFYGFPYRPSTGGIHKGDYHPIIGGK